MPGILISVSVEPGASVVAGQELCVVEAMKMQNVLLAERDGQALHRIASCLHCIASCECAGELTVSSARR